MRTLSCRMKPRSLRMLLLWLALCALMAVANAHEESASHEVAVVTNSNGDATAEEGPVVRCRICGAKVALKKDHMELPDTSKSVSARYSHELGKHGAEVHTFVNPSRVEMEVVAFKKAVGMDGDGFTSKATFFEGYSWKDFRCGGCNRHVGWKFHHDDFQQCIHSGIMEAVAPKAQEDLQSATAEQHAKMKQQAHDELVGQCVTATAGWWSYEVCYKKEVRQYHEEADGTRPSDWSMGVYVEDDVDKSRALEIPSTGAQIVHSFKGGQHCDENGELRNTQVVYTCCKSQPTKPTIDNVEEPSLCSYIITVCVPSLCTTTSRADTPYDSKAITRKCEAEFHATHESSPASFAALRWSTVISEDSSELDWARAMQFKT